MSNYPETKKTKIDQFIVFLFQEYWRNYKYPRQVLNFYSGLVCTVPSV